MSENDQVRKLENFLEKRFEEREAAKLEEAYKYENQKDIQESLESRPTDFYCRRCKCDYEDYRTTGIVESDWINPGKYIAKWNSKHKCGTWNIRYATDKHLDPYWTQSPKMKADQGNYYRDMIQPHETGFDMLYGTKFNQNIQ